MIRPLVVGTCLLGLMVGAVIEGPPAPPRPAQAAPASARVALASAPVLAAAEAATKNARPENRTGARSSAKA